LLHLVPFDESYGAGVELTSIGLPYSLVLRVLYLGHPKARFNFMSQYIPLQSDS
jgi:hypothetical protein